MILIRRSLLLLLLSVLLVGCQLRLGADVTIAADGSGRFELLVALDRELSDFLTDAGVDPADGIEELRASAPAWEISHEAGEAGQELRFSAAFEDPRELSRLVDDLHAALDPEDGRILEQVVVHRTSDGAVTFEAMAGLVPPTTVGASGSGVDVDGDDLLAFLRERGDEFVRYDLRVTLPAEPISSDADEVDGRTLVWHLPVGEQRLVSARSAVPRDNTWLLVAGVAIAALLITWLVVASVRRRRARRRVTSEA